MHDTIDRETLERVFGDENNYCVESPEDAESVFPDGKPSVFCSNWAVWVRRALGNRIKLYGYTNENNPTSEISRLADGHDFAILDDRWIVDGWVKNVEILSPHCVFDLNDPNEADEITRIYGDRTKWERNERLERSVDSESPERRRQLLAMTNLSIEDARPAMHP